MRAKLIINGVDFSPWILEEGLEQYEITRQERSVVGLDGVDYRTAVVKRGMNVSLTRMKDETWYRLLGALRRRPAEVEYVDDALGSAKKLFYVSAPTATTRLVRGNTTYFGGGSFTLEER
ncbi:MAG: hypothetical protein HFF17_15460 [Oscillospiraceae bacterium]|nr:hypothetical protein [Oscillospiraceae bacterium]MCI9165617.1 hypothetical protein [Oscillospiraceae bacterium]